MMNVKENENRRAIRPVVPPVYETEVSIRLFQSTRIYSRQGRICSVCATINSLKTELLLNKLRRISDT